jgi:hypothetical protein
MLAALTLPIVALGCFFASVGPVRGDGPVDYARDVQPILAAKCVRCHGPKKQEGGLRLDLRQRLRQGGDTGPAVVPGQEKGELLRRVRLTGDERMPPSGAPLSPAEIGVLRSWVVQGAAWPDELAGSERHDRHWAFRPIRRPPVPGVQDQRFAQSPVDAFIVSRLEAAGFEPSPEADRETLIRRLSLDLVGLPPSPEAVEAFVHDRTPGAYEALVDRLLASPHFGERWGRHWLDVARFAESDGYENDKIRADAWRWRDWVVDAINRDMPLDRFTILQLAGDLLPQATADDRLATGLHRNTLWNSAASGDKEEFRTRAVKDRAETTASAWMGLTLACAGCHSHKYDPISQREYYQLYAFFNNTDNDDVPIAGAGKSKIMALRAVARTSHVHQRGDFLRPGAEVQPATPAFLPPLSPRGKIADRLDLARWLVDPVHPLTARVFANHCWQHLFGQPLVPTPENFGLAGQPPTHPELLDWLASELVANRWSRKALVRTIVRSSAYRQASTVRPDLARVDPGNALVGRQNRFRVEAEIVRDLALEVGGLLDRKLGGPSIQPPFPEGLLDQRITNEALKRPTAEHHRRGLYIHVQRTLTHPTLAAFDGADGNQPCLRRERSTTPIQALTLLNDPVFRECTAALGERLRQATGLAGDRVDYAFRLCLSRAPTPAEHRVVLGLIDEQQRLGASEAAVWAGVARTMLNVEAFVTRE